MRIFHQYLPRKTFISRTRAFLFLLVLLIAAFALVHVNLHHERTLRQNLQAHGKPVSAMILHYKVSEKIISTGGHGAGGFATVCRATYTLKYPSYDVSDIFATDDYSVHSDNAFCRYVQNNVGKELSAVTLKSSRDTTRLRAELPLAPWVESQARPAYWIFLLMVMLICYIGVLYFAAKPARKKKVVKQK
jgi:hypothetical protein